MTTVRAFDGASEKQQAKGKHKWEVVISHDWVGMHGQEKGTRHVGNDTIYLPIDLIDWLIGELDRVKRECGGKE